MSTPKPDKLKIFVISGMSGAGKSTTLNLLEDLGFEAIDNLPLSLYGKIGIRHKDGPEKRHIALGIDPRTRGFSPGRLIEEVNALRAKRHIELTLVFIDCENQELIRRFSETRRKHPLAFEKPVIDGITDERALMAAVKAQADFRIDTTGLSIHDLRARLEDFFGGEVTHPLTLSVMSFGYGRGVPRNADIVLDVRFLKNPHYVPALNPLDGRDPKVAAHIMQDGNFKPFFKRISELVLMLIPLYRKEGKSYLTLAFGCTGGQHRSVFMAEEMSRLLSDSGYHVIAQHRDLVDER